MKSDVAAKPQKLQFIGRSIQKVAQLALRRSGHTPLRVQPIETTTATPATPRKRYVPKC
jgi:hypothetical protein